MSFNNLVRDMSEQVRLQGTEFERNSVPVLNLSIIKKEVTILQYKVKFYLTIKKKSMFGMFVFISLEASGRNEAKSV